MNDLDSKGELPSRPRPSRRAKITRAALTAVGGAVPFAGGLVSVLDGQWSEREQERVNQFFESYLDMLQDELKEKARTIVEIMARLDLQNEAIAARVESSEFQSLLKKSFRDWSGAESELKQSYIRNILTNAASTASSSDDVIRMFIDWLSSYSELHFQVIEKIYNNNGIGRGEIWRRLGKPKVREDSADADLYRMLIHDLSVGRITRQVRDTDYAGNFIKRAKKAAARKSATTKTMKSAFDDADEYELTGLGQDFVHYAMTEVSLKIEFEDAS